ncbi:hypothetical protein [Arthrobacter sp. MYb213]|uniref:hypothetical protein n=1 Tax=Arthrobacter sp. MYb213 TaxID=1848595 RepID=UPI000CFCCBB8|nr:hypothetical protein [Arthrobacter sp. MYb213]PRB69516.1 hypothetical protein CQ011_12195 [Arthrobacter sp. MYb213]
MSTTFTAGMAFKRALYEKIRDLYADDPATQDVLVCPGTPGSFTPDEIVAVTSLEIQQDFATMGPNRSREETLTVDVVFSCLFGGDDTQELPSQERAFELLSIIERHVRMEDTTLNGTVRHCLLTSVQTDGQTPAEYLHAGRGVDMTATFTARNRVRG